MAIVLKNTFIVVFLGIALIVTCFWLFRRQLAEEPPEVTHFIAQIPESTRVTALDDANIARMPSCFFLSEHLFHFFNCIRLCPMIVRPRGRHNAHLQHLWDTGTAQRDYQRLDGEHMPSRSGAGEI